MPEVLDGPAIEVTVEVEGVELVAGTLEAGAAGSAVTFSYAESYLDDGRAYALDPAMPLATGRLHPPAGKALFNGLADGAPDQWGRDLMRRGEELRARSEGGAPKELGPVDFLLATRDDLREGSNRLRHPASGDYYSPASRAVPRLGDLPALLRATDAVVSGSAVGGDEEIAELIAAGGSIGGAQPKVAVRTAAGALGIAKFTRRTVHRWDVVGWEGVAYELARRAGITVAPSELVKIDGRNVFVVERFDRVGDRRLGFASAFTMLGASDGEEHSYLELAEAIERHSLRAPPDLEELFRRIVFSILIGNVDEHLRNHALLRRSGGWSLSPCYDVNPNPESEGRLMLAVDEDDRSADLQLAASVARRFRLTASRANEVVGEVERGTRVWREVAIGLGLLAPEIEWMAQAFESGQRAVACRIVGTPPSRR